MLQGCSKTELQNKFRKEVSEEGGLLESQGIDVKMKCGRKLVIKLLIIKQCIAPARHVSDRRKKTGGLGQETG